MNKPTKWISRQSFLTILNAGLETGSLRFVRQIIFSWLAVYPSDIQVNKSLAKLLWMEGKKQQSIDLFRKLAERDPEDVDILTSFAVKLQEVSPSDAEDIWGSVYVLDGKVNPQINLPDWAKPFLATKEAMRTEQWEDADKLIHLTLGLKSDLALIAENHIMIAEHAHGADSRDQLVQLYSERWPECLQFKLRLADIYLRHGDESGGVNLLHECVSMDPEGQTPQRLWGKSFPYRPLWPERLDVPFDFPIPGEVAACLGWNILGPGEIIPPAVVEPANQETSIVEDLIENEPLAESGNNFVPAVTLPEPEPVLENDCIDTIKEIPRNSSRPILMNEDLLSVEDSFIKMAKNIKQPSLGRADGRFPLYVILSSRNALVDLYGTDTTNVIEAELKALATMIQQRPGWGAMVFFPDDPAIMTHYGLKPVTERDPWKYKLALQDLDEALSKQGSMIGALLIVGNDEIIPFHRLPNPTDDQDKEVPSDNPYASIDGNYFIPEWPLGRIAGESGRDASLQLIQIRRTFEYHRQRVIKANGILEQILRILQLFFAQRAMARSTVSYGMTAKVWQRSSEAVFKGIGDPKFLFNSPPQDKTSVAGDRLMSAQLNYFNLHGLEDAAEWYGQKVPQDPTPGPDYPVALSPENLTANGHAPKFVFTEACYGGHIFKKNESQSLALKFLSTGVLGVAASTTISYGSVNAPLIGADLLASLFWKFLKDGLTAGEAMMQSKVELVREMNRRQGFLDGEDQKTLISFIYYGDPLVSLDSYQAKSKSVLRMRSHPMIKAISDQKMDSFEPIGISTSVLKEVKNIVKVYLPGMDDGIISVCPQQESMSDGDKPLVENVKIRKNLSGRTVVTIQKSVEVAQKKHPQYARLTLGPHGKLIKLAISR